MLTPLIDTIFAQLQCTEALTREFIRTVLADIQLFDMKQHDYGPTNIAAFGERGVVVRMTDKLARIRRTVWGGGALSNEGLEDSYADQSVYGVIARMCRKGRWPGVVGEEGAGSVEKQEVMTAPPASFSPDKRALWCPQCKRVVPADGACADCKIFLSGPISGTMRAQ